MTKEPFMLVSLKEEKAKKLSQVLSSKTATRILEYLAGKDATATQISKDLKLPLSTVHYNIQQLVEAKLVIAEEFHYSSRGKEVNHYKLANKYIIIAPAEEQENLLQRLRGILPAAGVLAGIAIALRLAKLFAADSAAAGGEIMMQASAPIVDETAVRTMEVAQDAMIEGAAQATADAAPMMAQKASGVIAENGSMLAQEIAADGAQLAAIAPPVDVITAVPWWQSPALEWFLIGGAFVLLTLILWEVLAYWRWKRRS